MKKKVTNLLAILLAFLMMVSTPFAVFAQNGWYNADDEGAIYFDLDMQFRPEVARQVGEYINELRKKNGLAELKYDYNYEIVAMDEAANYAGYYDSSHRSSGIAGKSFIVDNFGQSMWDFMKDNGKTWANLDICNQSSVSNYSAESVANDWYMSIGHRDAMFDETATGMSIGYVSFGNWSMCVGSFYNYDISKMPTNYKNTMNTPIENRNDNWKTRYTKIDDINTQKVRYTIGSNLAYLKEIKSPNISITIDETYKMKDLYGIATFKDDTSGKTERSLKNVKYYPHSSYTKTTEAENVLNRHNPNHYHCEWTIDDPSIVSNENGVLTPHKVGTTYIRTKLSGDDTYISAGTKAEGYRDVRKSNDFEIAIKFTVAGLDLKKASSSLVQKNMSYNDYVNNGTKLEPDIKILYNGQSLTKGIDYTVEYTNNTTVGTATAIITGIGNYAGTVELDYNIVCTHNLKTLTGIKSTCVSTGLSDGKQCTICNTVTEPQVLTYMTAMSHDENGNWTHTWDNQYTSQEGCDKVVYRPCKYCDVVEEVSRTTSHVRKKIAQVNATCTTTGVKEYYKCSVCGINITQPYVIQALGHDPVLYKAQVNPTCTTDGKSPIYHCSRCGDVAGGAVIKALGHDLKDTIIPQTCITDGYTKVTCSRCDYTEQKNIVKADANSHNYISSVINPTCTAQGYTLYTCSYCKNSYKSNYTNATGHSWDNGIISKPPTCEADGNMKFTCKSCSTIDNRVITKTGHTFVTTKTIPATCTTNKIAEQTCSKCDKTTRSETPNSKLGHSWKVISSTQATCTTDGVNKEQCERCGEIKETIVNATGHKFDINDTCIKKCTVCNISEGYHNYQEFNRIEPSCTATGSIIKKCSKCGDTKTTTISKIDHELAIYSCAIPATCTNEGRTEIQKCRHCDYKVGGRTISRIEHDFELKKNAVAATCTSNGTTALYQCKNCSTTNGGVALNALGHNLNSVVTKPTCKTNGYTTTTCSRCDYLVVSDYTSTVSHSYDSGKVTKQATCGNDGVKTFTCNVCKATKTSVVKATGKHTFVAKVTKKPTSSATGVLTSTCKNCGFKKTSSIAKLAKTSISKITATSKGFKVSWKKVSSATGYQIQYSTSSSFKSPKTVTVTSNSTVSKSVAKLISKKKYYVRIRTYRTVNGTKYYSDWSSKKSIITKK